MRQRGKGSTNARRATRVSARPASALSARAALAETADLYAPLLTKKQAEILRLSLDEDLSLAEISSLMGIARQSVHEHAAAARKSVAAFEKKLGFAAARAVSRAALKEIADGLRTRRGPAAARRAAGMIDAVAESL